MEEEETAVGTKVKEFISREVGTEWEDELKVSARFRAFGGQRSDWEQHFIFWKDLIIKVGRHLGLFIIPTHQVKHTWFNREGLTPMCLTQVLQEMYESGDIVKMDDFVDPNSGRLLQILKRVVHLIGFLGSSTAEDLNDDYFIISVLLKEKAAQVVKLLADNHWNSSCIVTMEKFLDICGGSKEASAILKYLSASGKAKYLIDNKKDFIEGVKVSLSSGVISEISRLDYDVLHLIWTMEKLQRQIELIDQRCEIFRSYALDSLRSGSRKVALRHAKEFKLSSQSREKCAALLNRVEDVLRIIVDADSSYKVAEAIKIGARAIKENNISMDEVLTSLKELDDNIDALKQVDSVLENSPSYVEIMDEDIEKELKNLEEGISSELPKVVGPQPKTDNSAAADSLSEAMSSLELEDVAAKKPEMRQSLAEC